MDETFAPLAQAIGRAVLGAALLEKILLIDIAQRQADRGGLTRELEAQLSELERQPAGKLLATLRELGMSEDLASRVAAFIVRRNRLVHHFMDDPDVLVLLASEDKGASLVDGVDELAAECQRLVNEIGPLAFTGAEKALGITIPELIEALRSADPEAVEDERLCVIPAIIEMLGETSAPGSDEAPA